MTPIKEDPSDPRTGIQAGVKLRRRLNPRRIATISSLILLTTLVFPISAAAQLSAEIRETLRRSGRVDAALVTELAEDSQLEESQFDVIVVYRIDPSNQSGPSEQADRRSKARSRQTHIRERRARLLSRFTAHRMKIRRQFDGVPAISVTTDLSGLQALANDDDVLRVGLDLPVEVQLAEAVPLAGFTSLHTAGHDGAGIQVATIDTSPHS
jgi:hypothetical protein